MIIKNEDKIANVTVKLKGGTMLFIDGPALKVSANAVERSIALSSLESLLLALIKSHNDGSTIEMGYDISGYAEENKIVRCRWTDRGKIRILLPPKNVTNFVANEDQAMALGNCRFCCRHSLYKSLKNKGMINPNALAITN